MLHNDFNKHQILFLILTMLLHNNVVPLNTKLFKRGYLPFRTIKFKSNGFLFNASIMYLLHS